MVKKNLNKSTLSKACDIPYTTIDGWYKKGYEGLKLTTLRKLSNFFGTSLDYWASDEPFNQNKVDESNQIFNDGLLRTGGSFINTHSIPEDELKDLLDVYSKLPESLRKKFLCFLEDLTNESV